MHEKLVELLMDKPFGRATEEEETEHIEDVADYLISNGVTIQRWIPVTERLPEDDGEYLAAGNHVGWWCAILMFAKDGRKVNKYDFYERWENVWYDFDREYGHYICGPVTHWMPLPEPPKGE